MMKMSPLGIYGKSASSTLVSKLLFYGASFVSLWLVTRLLAKPDYGCYALALAVMWFASVAVSLGLDQAVLVRVARRKRPHDGQTDGLISAALLIALLVGTGAALGLALVAPSLALWIGLPALQFWLVALAPTIPLIAIGSIFESWYLARGAVWQGQTFPAIGQAMRVPVLALALLIDGSTWWVVGAEMCVALLPILLFLTDRSRERLRPPTRPAKADIDFGLRMLVARMSSEGIRRIDIFMLGALAVALDVADYHVAARLVVVLDVGRELLQPGFTTHIGKHLGQSDEKAARHEFDSIRAASFLISLAIAAGLILLAAPFLALFGNFSGAVPVVLTLVAGGLINVAFGPNSHLLKIAGQATSLLQVRGVMLVLLFMSNLALIPMYGAIGAALSSLVAVLVANIMFWRIILRREHIASINVATIAILVPAVVTSLLAAYGLLANPLAAAIVAGLALVYAYVEPLSWQPARAALARLHMRS